jgi:hypothetical protein
MIKIDIDLHNPYHNENKFGFRSLYDKAFRVSENRTLEFQISFYLKTLIGLRFQTAWRGRDHAGPEFEITLFGLTICLSLPDNRHWNYDKNTWYKYGEEELDE